MPDFFVHKINLKREKMLTVNQSLEQLIGRTVRVISNGKTVCGVLELKDNLYSIRYDSQTFEQDQISDIDMKYYTFCYGVIKLSA